MLKRTALIVPCYNEEKRLKSDEFHAFLSRSEEIDLWFVDDGSSDNTFAIISKMKDRNPQRIFTYRLDTNRGKAEAIRTSSLFILANNRYDFIGYIDADLSAPIEEVIPLNNLINDGRHLIVAGSRIKMAGRTIKRELLRHFASRIFATYYSQLLGVHNYDTQCGLKLFTAPFATKLFESAFESRWLFDLELFLRAQIILGRNRYAREVFEVPLNEWQEIGGSKLKITDFINAPLEVLKIYKRYHKKRDSVFASS